MNISMFQEEHHVNECFVKDLDVNLVKPLRGGVIVYTRVDDKLYFCFGIDRDTQEMTDFGGGIGYKSRDKNIITGSLREFSEESLGVFGRINECYVKNSLCIYDDSVMIIFLSLRNFLRSYRTGDSIGNIGRICSSHDIVLKASINLFRRKCLRELHPEVTNIVWINEETLKSEIFTSSQSKLYEKVRGMLSPCINNIISSLK